MVLPLIGRALLAKGSGGGIGSNATIGTPKLEMSVQGDVQQMIRHLDRVQRNQVPFVVASSLTRTAQEAQKHIQQAIPNRFNVTKKWWLKQQPTGIKITPATKQRWIAEVYTNAYFASLQEDGGTKTPFKGSRIAVPSAQVKAAKQRRSGGVREVAGRPRTFFATTNTGKTGVYRRRTKKRYPIELLYTFTPTARIERRFGFVTLAQQSVERHFRRIFMEQLQRALRTAR